MDSACRCDSSPIAASLPIPPWFRLTKSRTSTSSSTGKADLGLKKNKSLNARSYGTASVGGGVSRILSTSGAPVSEHKPFLTGRESGANGVSDVSKGISNAVCVLFLSNFPFLHF